VRFSILHQAQQMHQFSPSGSSVFFSNTNVIDLDIKIEGTGRNLSLV
jgi:hypothetical protein